MTYNPGYTDTTIYEINATIPSPVDITSFNEKVTVTVIMSAMAAWSICGNLITMLAIATSPHMRTKINIFIFSLALSDLLSNSIASPLFINRVLWGFVSWEWGSFACTLYWCVEETTSYATTLHIAMFSVWRFVVIKWPLKINHKPAKRTVLIWIAVIWTISIVFGGFIFSMFPKVERKPKGELFEHWPHCAIDTSKSGLGRFVKYYTFTLITFIMLPMIIVAIMSILIALQLTLRREINSTARIANEKKAIAQLTLITISFVIGYLPLIIFHMWSSRATSKKHKTEFWFGIVSYMFLRFSEALNPIAYNLASRKMRTASMKVLQRGPIGGRSTVITKPKVSISTIATRERRSFFEGQEIEHGEEKM